MPEWAKLQRITRHRSLLMQATRGWKKDSDRAMTPAAEAVRVPAHLVLPGSPQVKKLYHIHDQLSLGKSCKKEMQKVLHLCVQGRFSSVQLFSTCTLWPAMLLCQEELFSGQEYWSLFVSTGCQTLLEHYISCCPSHQTLWLSGAAARTLMAQAGAPLEQLGLKGQTQVPQGSFRNKPHWTNQMHIWK